jgi:hypothetical protein
MKNSMKKIVGFCVIVTLLTGCGTIQNLLNPFYEPPSERATLGNRDDRALNEGEGKVNTARKALESMSTYQRANDPKPYNPVMQPAVVRLMWIPDHLNKSGDLVPAHYYYLKVLSERWAVQDAFELEGQLGGNKGSSSNVPFAYSDQGFGR